MNTAQRDAFIQLTQAAEKMADFLSEVIVTEAAYDLADRWYKARNRYFTLEHEARKAKASAQGRTRQRGNSTRESGSANDITPAHSAGRE